MKSSRQKHSEKDDHLNADVVAFHRLHLRDVFCQSTIDLQDDN